MESGRSLDLYHAFAVPTRLSMAGYSAMILSKSGSFVPAGRLPVGSISLERAFVRRHGVRTTSSSRNGSRRIVLYVFLKNRCLHDLSFANRERLKCGLPLSHSLIKSGPGNRMSPCSLCEREDGGKEHAFPFRQE